MKESKKNRAIVLGVLVATQSILGVGLANAGSYVPNEVLVRYKPGADRSRAQMTNIRTLLSISKVQRYSGSFGSFEKIVLAKNTNVANAVRTLSQLPGVEYAQPNYIVHTMNETQPRIKANKNLEMFSPLNALSSASWPIDPPKAKDPELAPAPSEGPSLADPLEKELYGMALIGAKDAWKSNQGSRDVTVAVIDTGIDYNHEDLALNLFRSQGSDGQTNIGYDFANGDALPFDDAGHGSHTAGTVGGVGFNGVGVVGVSPKAKIMALKFLAGNGSGSTSDAISAIEYSVKNGARILSNSWGMEGPVVSRDALYDAIAEAGKKDVLFIAAAGNSSIDNDGGTRGYPASYELANIISVAATDSTDTLAEFSNYGKKTVHLAAPGVKILSTIPGGGYKAYSGTSMATPHVAGAAALLLSANPKLTALQVKKILLDSADKIEGLKEKTITGGRLNVAKAMQLAKVKFSRR